MQPQPNEIHITGAGIITALGAGKTATLHALLNRRSGIRPVKYLQTRHTGLPVGEVKHSNDELREILNLPPTEPFTRSTLLALPAIREALRQARLEHPRPTPPPRIALLSGITVGGMDRSEHLYHDFLHNDTQNAYIDLNDCGASTDLLADHIGDIHLTATIVTACSSSANTLMMAVDLIRSQRTDIAIAGGAECLSRYHLNGFNTLKILDPQHCRPFDRDRAGTNLGEGAAYLILETAQNAAQRNVTPIGKITGYRNVCDAYHPTASSPNGLGPFLAMKGALENARLNPDDIHYINAHGTGTPNNDLTEGLAIMQLFRHNIPPVSSLKAATGHTTSAAGSIEAVISLLALEHNFLPINLNFRHPIEAHNFQPVTHPDPPRPLRHILSNSFGFGGNDSAIILSKT